jgi:PAS domain S-box-containing protein
LLSRHGFDPRFTKLADAFCTHALEQRGLLEVTDALHDPRFVGNGLVHGSHAVRFYAGHTYQFDGVVLGTVCVLDRRPRQLSPGERAVLADLAGMLDDLLLQRHQQAVLQQERERGQVLVQALDQADALRDRAERSRQHQVRLSEERYRLLWQTTNDAVLIVDDLSRIEFANPAVERVFGHAPESLIGQDLALLQPEHMRPLHRLGFERYLSSGVKTLDWRATEAVGLHRDGHEIPIEIAFSDMVLDGHRVFAAFLRDISVRRRAEDALRISEARLRDAQKMEVIGLLAGGIAHDFNNILASVLGNTALAMDDLDPEHPAMLSLRQIRKAGERGRELVRQILSFARRRPQELRQVPLQPLLTDVAGLLRLSLPAKVQLSLALPPETLHVWADATQVEQVLMNLSTNALHALGRGDGGGGGRIELGLEPVQLSADGARALGGLAPGAYAHLWVSDTGCGMDEAVLPRVFEPFFTTKPPGEGTGLGLSVAHGIVTGHGGIITVASQLGSGSSFHVYLPANAGEADPQALPQQPAAEAARRGNGEHVVYIDDDEVMVVMVERLLQRLGYRVSTYEDPARALAEILASPERAADIGAVITDLNMPGTHGIELARTLLAARPQLPVILSSGNLPEQTQAEAQDAGIAAVLHKQNTLEELPALLQRVLAGNA